MSLFRLLRNRQMDDLGENNQASEKESDGYIPVHATEAAAPHDRNIDTIVPEGRERGESSRRGPSIERNNRMAQSGGESPSVTTSHSYPANLQVFLYYHDDTNQNQRVVYNLTGNATTIGRRATNSISFRKKSHVSKDHAVIDHARAEDGYKTPCTQMAAPCK